MVNTNIQSLFAQRAYTTNGVGGQLSQERLATGLKINRAADDAAGLSISQKLTATIKGLYKAKQNSADGISLIQTAEGGLSIAQDNLQRIRELMVQAANGTNATNEIDAIQRELNERIRVISDAAAQVQFNGISLLGGASNITLQTGSDTGQTTTINLASGSTATGVNIMVNTTALGSLGEGAIALNNLRLANTTVVNAAGTTSAATGSIANIDTMITNVSRMRSYLGAMQNSLESKMEYVDIAIESSSASRSRIRDVDVASESSNFTKFQILQQTASSMLAQANATPQIALNLLP
ncbi:MAG: flagellin [Candidatus Caenarcaniphilales bacterium]|jgi:flagellin|nr:flagellin [Candidatus Caenarcaniphilales bacterium]